MTIFQKKQENSGNLYIETNFCMEGKGVILLFIYKVKKTALSKQGRKVYMIFSNSGLIFRFITKKEITNNKYVISKFAYLAGVTILMNTQVTRVMTSKRK